MNDRNEKWLYAMSRRIHEAHPELPLPRAIAENSRADVSIGDSGKVDAKVIMDLDGIRMSLEKHGYTFLMERDKQNPKRLWSRVYLNGALALQGSTYDEADSFQHALLGGIRELVAQLSKA